MELLSAPEVGERLNVSEQRVRILAQKRRLVGLKVGGRWMFTAEDVARYLADKAPAA